MIRLHFLALGTALLLVAAGTAAANAPPEQPAATDAALSTAAPPEAQAPADPQVRPVAAALRAKLATLPTEGTAQELKERAVVSDFYAARQDAPLWLTEAGLSDKGEAIVAALASATEWGLEAKDFPLPDAAVGKEGTRLEASTIADADVALSLALLKYARYARGGRIIDPTILLNSNLDRKPQLLDPEAVFKDAVAAEQPDVYMRSLHPKQPQFEKLRQALLVTKNKALAKKIVANMEEWRWMPDDLGEVHIMANVPEYMVRLVKNNEAIHTERIVVGEIGKQTTIFSRNLKTIVFKPMWRVPESIKVRELQPNLRRGGSMFRQYDLELETKDGKPLDYHTIDWNTADIRDYEVVQPPGRKNVMGVVKFTFPSQHTIFMHDTVDKWMFAQSQRTLSHGCLRLRNPMKMAELVLAEDKGWDAAKTNETMQSSRDNIITIDRKIPMHLAYFTAWVGDDGKLKTFSDIYGHEKRITLALDGKWEQIDVGRDHLAPVEDVQPSAMSATGSVARQRRNTQPTIVDLVGSALGNAF